LPGLELGVCLVDDIESATALNNLASSVSALKRIEGGENFHGSSGRRAHFTGDRFSVKPILDPLFSDFGALAVVWRV
tara:strand:- start:82 stop:312 length:231 start_codon:yes stop_codon:yes gene_type:complete